VSGPYTDASPAMSAKPRVARDCKKNGSGALSVVAERDQVHVG
jgi:hypothetical protein